MSHRIDLPMNRREFARLGLRTAVSAAAFVAGATAAAPVRAADQTEGGTTIPTPALLNGSPFVYVSPIQSNGEESRCHAELWYGWLDDAIVVTVATDRWKAQSISRGLTTARIWVGDHGRWKTWYGGTNDDFLGAPRFDARGERVEDDALLERLLALYETKYPAEIAQWREPMRRGNADGSRVLLRYTPL